MRFDTAVFALAVFITACLTGCGSDSTLVVYLKTDLVAGVEFTSVEVEVFGDAGRDEAATSIASRTLSATRAMRFVPERRLSSFEPGDAQNLLVVVRLRDAAGLIVAERPTRLNFAGDYGLRVLVTRNCARVTCPAPGGAALNAACFDGRCVDDRCQPDALEFCPDIACTNDGSPPSACASTATCAQASCEDGVCLYAEPVESVCGDTEWCDPFRGCLPQQAMPLMDAGLLDAEMDADVDADTDDMNMSVEDATTDSANIDAELIDADVMDGTMEEDMSVSVDMSVDAGPVCGAGETLCGVNCANTESDVHHCGDCDVDCAALPNVDPMTVTCSVGICTSETSCRSGFANCSGDPLAGCETDISSATQCGTCTTVCGPGTPVCSADVSGVYACSSGCGGGTPSRCGAECVDLESDPEACGSCSHVCPTSDHGHATCTAHTCGIECDFGYHLCGSVCVSNDSILSCGSSCTTCPGAPAFAMATCDGVSCGWQCQPGYNLCGGACVPTTSTSACGPACIACSAPPANGTAYCDGLTCGVTCNVGFNACSGSCVTADDPTHCGASCTVCPVPPTNGSATCTSGSCGIVCGTGYHACGDNCVSNSALTTCGGTCGEAPCTAPMNGTATCNGATCGFTCAAGFVVNGSICDIAPPRPLRPMTAAVTTTQTPTLYWQNASGVTGASIEVCMDRACTMPVTTATAVGTSYTLTEPLAAGVYFWRLRGRIGTSTGMTYGPAWEITVPARSGAFDTSYGQGLRDVDGDGFSDVALGNSVVSTERVFIFRGRSAGLAVSPDYTLSAGYASTRYGQTVALTDINRDGFADVVVGEPGYMSSTGRIHVHYGSAVGPALTPSLTVDAPSDAGGFFGSRVHPIGDVNADGFGDIAVGCASTRAYAFHGASTGLPTTPARSYTNGIYTRTDLNAIASGDFNGDGFSDFALVPTSMPAFIYFGSSLGAPATAGLAVGMPHYSRMVAGDFNGDGYADLVRTNNSTMALFAGAPTGTYAQISTVTVPDVEGNSSFGNYLAAPGDLNGDGIADLVIAASEANYGSGVGVGKAWVYMGGGSGFASVPQQTIGNPTTTNYAFGWALGMVGDVDGDGRVDVQIGTYGNESYFFAGIGGMFGIASTPTLTVYPPMGYTGMGWASALATQ